MYKSKLQELCQRRSWGLPDYAKSKDGPDHMPRFTASVTVNGQVFETPVNYPSAKEAQNTAARIAFEYFSGPLLAPTSGPAPAPVAVDAPPVHSVSPVAPPSEMQPVAVVPEVHPVSPSPSSLPMPPRGLLPAKNDAKIEPTNGEVLQPNNEDPNTASMVYRISISPHDKSYKDTLHMYKNRLQQYAQKQNLGFPVYTSESQGPPHARCFKSMVSVGGKSYETLEFFSTLKEAEQAAAKVACQFLSVDATQEDGGFCKNLLQEFAQKKGLLCPSYETVSSGMSHRPVFVSTVEIGSHTFRGAEAKTKKQAEMNAARVAYSALVETHIVTESSGVSSSQEFPVASNLSNIQSTPTVKISEDVILPTSTIKEQEDAILSSPVIGKLKDAILPAPLSKKHEAATDEGSETQAKRAKSSPENEDIDAPPSVFSNGNFSCGTFHSASSQEERSTTVEHVDEQKFEGQPLPAKKTVVLPQNSSVSVPGGASVMPYTDDQWIAYKIEPHQESSS